MSKDVILRLFIDCGKDISLDARVDNSSTFMQQTGTPFEINFPWKFSWRYAEKLPHLSLRHGRSIDLL